VANRLTAGAQARAETEQAEINARAREEAIAKFIAGHEETGAAIASKFESALAPVAELVEAVEAHIATTRANMVGIPVPVPGFGRPAVPSVLEVLGAFDVIVRQNAGVDTGLLYPKTALDPVAPFLPAPVGAV
jgi:hypothetical protein